ncbi:PspC domain-containing protein [Spirosoma endophyticum]|uniref:Phage shock protein C (PspC) family protein n=1 Tax=Spirosoma endophyticum TaxID=662367 RepID=A0A1I2AL78_9BACT|nr:PspC domain-containing protein [Spirosoma endophyticum]SFE44509.1 phage shock protein C (PspC) family protein [Spirosoma endophyticum]
MKKTISINISGVIFHIEEDGYDKLRSYLTTVQQYFSTYEDSQEIVTDIENRIAEKLLAKLKAADKQVVSLEDVNELTAAMGTVADFEAVEEEEVLVTNGGRHSAQGLGQGPKAKTGPGAPENPLPHAPSPEPFPRRLVRDLRRKTLGGVCAGLAHYFNMDVVWVRLIFLILFLALPPLGHEFGAGVSGFTFILYIAMWIALPGTMGIEEDKTVKKFFRNPEDKVLGGVASGIAAYFGVDTGIIRLLFVLGIVFFGVGFLLYIVLWMIAPQANTLTEKMEMQGQPITLTNIENSIKQNLNINETANNESTLTRVLLFPFRAIATIIGGLGRALGPLLNGVVGLIRVFAGVLMLVVAFALMVACLAVLGAFIGLDGIQMGNLPIDMIRNDVTFPMVLAAFLTGIIPAFGLAILGVMLIMGRSVLSGRTALTLAGVWLVSLVIFAGTVTPLINSFQRRGTVEETKVLNVAAAIPTFAMSDVENDDNWRPSIDVKGYDGTALTLVQSFRAQGSTRTEAQANARQIKYVYTVKDSTVSFEETLELAPKARFRAQDLDMELMIPYEKPFRMTREFARFIRNEFGEKELDRMGESIWKFTKQDGLVCINFPREKDRDDNDEDNDVTDITDDVQDAVANELGDDFDHIGSHTRQFNVTSFSKVDISGAFVVRFRKGDTYKVVADGREDDMSDMDVRVNGNMLEVKIDRKGGLFNWGNRKRVGLTITVPGIDELKLSGASKASLVGFGNYKNLDIDMSGACRTVFDGSVEKLSLDLSGASNAVLRGHVNELEADLGGASKIEATGLSVDKASVDASGASHANFGHVGSLDSETSGASKVTRQ